MEVNYLFHTSIALSYGKEKVVWKINIFKKSAVVLVYSTWIVSYWGVWGPVLQETSKGNNLDLIIERCNVIPTLTMLYILPPPSWPQMIEEFLIWRRKESSHPRDSLWEVKPWAPFLKKLSTPHFPESGEDASQIKTRSWSLSCIFRFFSKKYDIIKLIDK